MLKLAHLHNYKPTVLVHVRRKLVNQQTYNQSIDSNIFEGTVQNDVLLFNIWLHASLLGSFTGYNLCLMASVNQSSLELLMNFAIIFIRL